jgi:glycosyltransferase involved in cell wall biosynthesis
MKEAYINKRILLIIGANCMYGAEWVSYDIIKMLKKEGFKIHVVISGWGNGEFENLLINENISYSKVKLGWYYINNIYWSLDSLINLPLAIYRYIIILISFKPNIIYHINLQYLFLLYPLFIFKKNILHIHEQISKSRLQTILIKILNHRISKYIAISNFIKSDLIKLNIPLDKITVVYNTVNSYNSNVVRTNKLNRLGYVGQIINHKGLLSLFYIVNSLSKYKLNFSLNIFGSGEDDYINYLKLKAKELNIEKYLVWHGYTNNKNKIYENIDLLIVPTERDEPFGMVAIEAMSFAIPCIVSNRGALSEIVDNDFNGYVVDIKDYDFVSELIFKIFNNNNLYNELSMNSIKTVKTKFNSNNSFERIINLIKNL